MQYHNCGNGELPPFRRDPETGEPMDLEPHYPGSAVDAPSGDISCNAFSDAIESLTRLFPQEGDE